jgi:hypothetical protein
VACADNNTTSTCPGSTHCFDGFCIDSSCQQICVQSDGTQGVVQNDAGSTMVKPCQVITCGAVYCTGAGAACCSASCVDTRNDPNNCGGCGITCTAPSTCAGGSCNCAGVTCASWETCCTNACFDLNFDNANCGACGAPCVPGKVCDFGGCIQGCLIGGITYWPGTQNPLGTCQVCDPFGSGSTTGWTPAPDGQFCSSGGGDVCVGGSCKVGCLISSLPDGTSQVPTLEPANWVRNGCYICNPAVYINRLTYDPALDLLNCADPNSAFYPFASAGIAGGVGSDNRFWVTGGWNLTGPGGSVFISNEAWGFDPIANNWIAGNKMTQQREEAAGATSAAGVIFLFGGLDSAGDPLSSVEYFDPGPPAKPWVSLTPANWLSTPRHLGSAVYVASVNLIYVIGGENGWNGNPVDTIETYLSVPPYTHTVLAAANTAGLVPANAALTGPTGQPAIIGSSLIDGMNGFLYAVGGLAPYALTAHQSVWAYKLATNAWTWAPSLGSAQSWAGVVIVPPTPAGTVYDINGFNGFGPSTAFQTAAIGGAFAGSLNQPTYAREGGMAFYSPTDNRIYLIGGTDQGVYLAPQPLLEALPLNATFGAWVPQY